MKFLNLLFVSILLSSSSKAQSANTLMFGASVLHAGIQNTGSATVYEQSLQTRLGFFATNRLAIGLCLETGINNKTVPYGITLFSRWYAGKTQHQTLKFFIEAGAGIADHTPQRSELMFSERKWMKAAVYISPGINVFLSRSVALELAPEYRYIDSDNSLNRLGARAGIKIFLSEQVFKRTFPNKFKSSF
jgi:hypothetical protein